MIDLFHGSTLPIEHPLANAGRADLDFGRGFYLTQLQAQAERWAFRIQLIRRQPQAWINIYRFDLETALTEGFRMLRMNAYDRQWLDFIVESRNGKEPWKAYDIIEGGVANDRVIDTVENYMDGTINAEQALGKLRFTTPNHQICLLNQKLIDKHLHYQKSELITTDSNRAEGRV